MTRARAIPIVVAGAFAIAVACDGGSPAFTPGVPGNTRFDELSGSQSKALCASGQAYAKAQLDRAAFRDLVCRAAALFALSVSQDGVSDATAPSACEDQYTVCQSRLADAGGPLGSGIPDDGSNGVGTLCSGGPPACAATVDQYAACLNERYGLTAGSYPPCSAFTADTVDKFIAHDGAYPGLDDGPACEAFVHACPGYFVQSPVPIR